MQLGGDTVTHVWGTTRAAPDTLTRSGPDRRHRRGPVTGHPDAQRADPARHELLLDLRPSLGLAPARVLRRLHADRLQRVSCRISGKGCAVGAAAQPVTQPSGEGSPLPIVLSANWPRHTRARAPQTIDALESLPEIGADAPIGYSGMTPASPIDIPLAVADPRIRAAIFGGVSCARRCGRPRGGSPSLSSSCCPGPTPRSSVSGPARSPRSAALRGRPRTPARHWRHRRPPGLWSRGRDRPTGVGIREVLRVPGPRPQPTATAATAARRLDHSETRRPAGPRGDTGRRWLAPPPRARPAR